MSSNARARYVVIGGLGRRFMGCLAVTALIVLMLPGLAGAEQASVADQGFWCSDSMSACEKLIADFGLEEARTTKTTQVQAIEAEQAAQVPVNEAELLAQTGVLAVSGNGSLSSEFAWRLGSTPFVYSYCDQYGCREQGSLTHSQCHDQPQRARYR